MTATLRVEGITKAYGGVHALTDCTLTARSGEITGLIGPNGSGKTTLFNIVTGYERPDAGRVFLDARELTGAPPARVFGYGVGRTFQLTRIFPRLTVLENMLVPAQRGRAGRRGEHHRALRHHAMELLAFTGISGHANALAGTLSYGQRKLLELSYVLIADPEIVLLDEPAGGVNPSLVNQLADRIGELNRQGRTFLVVEHNMEFVMGLCHQVTVLDSGTVIASGTPGQVRADQRVLGAYLGTGTGDG